MIQNGVLKHYLYHKYLPIISEMKHLSKLTRMLYQIHSFAYFFEVVLHLSLKIKQRNATE